MNIDHLRDLRTQSVTLPYQLTDKGLYESIFRQEPAIARLDWLFTPTHNSSKHLPIAIVRTSTPVKEASS